MKMPPLKTQYFPLAGGLDTESAQLTLRPGVVISAINYESSALEGYERVGGYERFDGRARPSDAAYRCLRAAVAFMGVVVGDTVTGATSTATARVIAIRTAAQIVVTRVTGVFAVGESLTVAGNAVGVFDGNASDITGFDDNTFMALAADHYRADIDAVPGSGAVRGIAVLNGTMYAWRDNVAATVCNVFKSTAAGWSQVFHNYELAFSGGSGTEPAVGANITKGAVSAIVKRVVTESGTWQAGTAKGRFIVTAPSGGAFTVGAFTAGVTATASGAETAIAQLPGGRLDAVVYNFTGRAGVQRIYGADGVNRGFEFDGEVLVPISTGMTVDKPVHCVAHKGHLFFSFEGSVQHSAITDPYRWSAVVGAAEIAAGDVVTGFQVLPSDADGGALMVFAAARTWVLYGSSSADWRFVNFADDVGAQRWSVQSLGRVLVFDTLGVAVVSATQAFGNFTRSPVSARIQALLTSRKVVASVVNRADNRMRLFFATGDALSITPIPTAEGGTLAFLPINYGRVVSCTCADVIAGESRTFFGSDNGMVYEVDRGRSFDGAEIVAYLKLAFNHVKSPMEKKRFRRCDLESRNRSACGLQVQGEYSLGDPEIGLTDVVDVAPAANGAYYSISNYGQSYYSVPRNALSKIRVDGVGTTLCLAFVSRSASELPHTLQSVSVLYTPRRLDR
ncbi:hypothetical protein ASE28_01470 [Acidovorax sp. Root219]|nr:hypothetical protein ASE28_01470 [Acidovorax sp. Root219]